MTNQEILTLCVNLAKAENEEEVVDILKSVAFWDDPKVWEDYDRNPNNFSTIGNQQSKPDAALVEKIINSVDAVLMRECQRRGIKPDSPQAPRSIEEAVKEYFGIYKGKLSSIDASQRSKLAENILLVATGEKSNPSYSIIDFGEGQTPKRIPDTFLSLNKKNKLNVQFVQGKFNMGGTGALQFCSKKHNLQLIISRRDPEIAKYEEDETKNKWGFTIVRREDPKGNMRSSSFRYLAPEGKILMFDCEKLPLLPKEYPEPYGKDFNFGTFIKLYEYQLGGGLNTIVKLDLYYRLSLLLPNIALPITMFERRKGYQSDSYHIVMSGLSVRLDEDKSKNLEPNFPNSDVIRVMGQEMKVLIYAFKKGKREKYTKNEGIVFTVNGQSQGFLHQAFFERKAVGMSYLADSILVIVDCSKIERRIQEDLFMNSRDRLRDGVPIRSSIESELERIIRHHDGLRALREKRRREEIRDKLQDSKPLVEILENFVAKHPLMAKLFTKGSESKIRNPFNLVDAGVEKEFRGKKFPTYFKITKQYSKNNPKIAPINRRFRVQFETDAENDYFNRDIEPGQFSIFYNNQLINDFSLNLWNGLATLTVTLPSNVKIGDILFFHTEAKDETLIEPFSNDFYVKVTKPEEEATGLSGQRKESPGNNESKQKRKLPLTLALPNIIKLRKKDENWSRHFKTDEDALSVKDTGDKGYDFYINLDNVFFQLEIKNSKKINQEDDIKLLEARFTYGIVLIGIALLKHFETESKRENDSQKNGIYNEISLISKAISPVLLPMISYLGSLEVD